LAVALAPIRDKFGLKRVIVSTYQSTSGAGGEYLEQLENDTRVVLDGNEKGVGRDSPAFNLLPAIGPLEKEGRFGEEYKLENELRKILEMPDLPIVATAVRVPTRYSHGESVVIETETAIDPETARVLWRSAPGMAVLDDPDSASFPTPRTATGTDPVWVGRIRSAGIFPNDLAFWIVADNLLKGAALNAVQIAVALSERERRK
jgi:aspartate-semialdehyde dehydrogenase